MGTDITTSCEYKNKDGEFIEAIGMHVFVNRCYGVFAFLAGVRNYSGIKPIVEPRGKPDDYVEMSTADYYDYGYENPTTWLLVSELAAFDYDSEMEDRRVSIDGDGGCTCPVGQGTKMTWREFLGTSFFTDLDLLVKEGIERVVLWFD